MLAASAQRKALSRSLKFRLKTDTEFINWPLPLVDINKCDIVTVNYSIHRRTYS